MLGDKAQRSYGSSHSAHRFEKTAARAISVRPMTAREMLERLLDQLSDSDLEAEYERLRQDVGRDAEMAPLPEGWGETPTGEPMPNVVAAIHRSRGWH
jgi:hypothetical protein